MNYMTNCYLPEEDHMYIRIGNTLENLYNDEKALINRLYALRMHEPRGKRKLYNKQHAWFSLQQDMLLELRDIRDEICMKLAEKQQ